MVNPSEDEDETPNLLLLFLGLHEHSRVPPNAWDYLCIQDLLRLSVTSKTINEKLKMVEYTKSRDGRDYLVPFPGFPGLLSTKMDTSLGAGLFPHQLASIQAMRKSEEASPGFGSLRGGVLGDAPGLGKTISILALIVSSAGKRPVDPPEFWDESSLQEDWALLRDNPAKQEDLLRVLRPMRIWIRKYAPHYVKQFQTISSFISPPYEDARFPTIRSFQDYIIRNLGPIVPPFQLDLFRRGIVQIKSRLDKRFRKMFADGRWERLIWERQLLPTSATLIVVPDALLEHWHQQICRHLNLDVFRDNKASAQESTDNSSEHLRGLIYLDGIGDLADIPTESLLGFNSDKPRPDNAWELCQYFIVITTFSRCQKDFRNEVGMTTHDEGRHGSATTTRKRRRSADQNMAHSNPLLGMRWLRLVVDEGHELGTHETATAATQFINRIAAERRWVLSGTPTTGDEDSPDYNHTALDQIQRLLLFLRHPVYGTFNNQQESADGDSAPRNRRRNRSVAAANMDQRAKSKWNLDIKNLFLAKDERGRENVLAILKSILVMHRKEDIKLPKPIFLQAEVDVPIADTFENLPVVQQSSKPDDLALLLHNYLHSENFQSLVDKAQAEYIVNVLKKARLELVQKGGGYKATNGHVNMMSTRESTDLRPIKAIVYSRDQNNLLSVTEQLYRNLPEEHIAEAATTGNDIGGELYRFRHGVKECKRCPVCQRLTPLHSREGQKPLCQQMLLEVVVHEDPPRRFLIEPERIIRALNVPLERMKGESMEDYHKSRTFWRPADLVQVDIRNDHPLHPRRKSEEYWDEHGSGTCRQLATRDSHLGQDWYFGPIPPIASSNGRVQAQVIKWQACGKFHSHARWYTGTRLQDCPLEKIEEDVFILSLDANLTHGLDLSFATHMFLLEAIDDAALLEQVTSRANRLGATGPVRVETVNIFYKLSDHMQATIDAIKPNTSKTIISAANKKSSIRQEKTQLSKVVCQFCFRQFNSYGEAESHEASNCPRNATISISDDSHHLSSIYRQIRPPKALSA